MRVLLLILCLFGSPVVAGCTVTRVVDGDTLHLDCGAGDLRVRLLGYDTPEVHHPHCPAEALLAARATAVLAGLVARGPVTGFAPQGLDRYGRTLAHVAIAGQDVTAFMLATPLARPYAGHAHPDWCAGT
jgi:endonuclease YncB( thermonuclease family)